MVKNGSAKAGVAGDVASIPGSGRPTLPLKKEMATCLSILTWKNPINRGAWRATAHGVAKSRAGLSTCQQHVKWNRD